MPDRKDGMNEDSGGAIVATGALALAAEVHHTHQILLACPAHPCPMLIECSVD